MKVANQFETRVSAYSGHKVKARKNLAYPFCIVCLSTENDRAGSELCKTAPDKESGFGLKGQVLICVMCV